MSDPRWSGWQRAVALALGPLVALGFTRFAYSLLLPGMHETFGWSLGEAGALNTANAAGFLVGALLASRIGIRFGHGRAFAALAVISGLALLAMAPLQSWPVFLVWRAIGGVATAGVFVLGSALAPAAMPQRPETALAIYFGGTGMGMILAGLIWGSDLLPPGETGWRIGWLVLGLLALAFGLAAGRVARALEPMMPLRPVALRQRPAMRRLAAVLIANALYGAGYVGYLTFIAALLAERGLGIVASALVFCLIGGASLAASPWWGRWLERRDGGSGFSAVSLAVAGAMMLALASMQVAALVISALCFGAAFMAGPAAVAIIARRVVPAHDLAAALGMLTATFSLGQALGPPLSGMLADRIGHLDKALWIGPLLLCIGAAVAGLQRRAKTACDNFPPSFERASQYVDQDK